MLNKFFKLFATLSVLGVVAFGVGCSNYDDDIDSLQKQINELQGTAVKVADLQTQLSALQSASVKAEDITNAVNAAKADLEKKLAEAQSSYDSKLAAAQADLEKKIAALEAASNDGASAEEVAALQKEVADAKAAVAAVETSVADLEEKLAMLEDALGVLFNETIPLLGNTMAGLSEQIGDNEVAIAETTEALQALLENLGDLSALGEESLTDYIDNAVAGLLSEEDFETWKLGYEAFYKNYTEFKGNSNLTLEQIEEFIKANEDF